MSSARFCLDGVEVARWPAFFKKLTSTTRRRLSRGLKLSCGRMARSARSAATSVSSMRWRAFSRSRARRTPKASFATACKKCAGCRKQFTARKGTVFEDSHVPLTLWFQAVYLMCSSKKGVSANQLHRTLGVTLQTAWFMGQRIREAMRSGDLAPMGSAGGIVEVDETVIGRTEDAPKGGVALRGRSGFRNTVLTLVERGGSARSFHVDGARIADLKPLIQANLSREARLMTDEWGAYKRIGKEFAEHHTVQSSLRGIRSSRRRSDGDDEHRRGIVQRVQARYERRLPALQREAFASLPRRIRFPIFKPRRFRRRR